MDELDTLINDANSLIDRLQHEYNKFFAGAEKKPPIKLRLQLDKMMDRARNLQRQSQSSLLRFKTQNAINKYLSYKTMWEKRMLEREKSRS